MKSDLELTAGKIVKTESYWEEKYEGGAYYDIVSTTNMTVDNATCIQLNNGLYAELHVINDTVTVNQFGAYGDGEHDDSDAINNAINSNYKNIKFESETYKINKRIDIQSSDTVLLGNGATITFDDNFTFNDDFIIGIFDYEEIVKNIEIQNLAIINNNTTYANEYFMLKIIRSRKC